MGWGTTVEGGRGPAPRLRSHHCAQPTKNDIPLFGMQITVSLSCWLRQMVVSGISEMMSDSSHTPYSVTSQSLEKHLDGMEKGQEGDMPLPQASSAEELDDSPKWGREKCCFT